MKQLLLPTFSQPGHVGPGVALGLPWACRLQLAGGVGPGGRQLPVRDFEGEGPKKGDAQRVASAAAWVYLQEQGYFQAPHADVPPAAVPPAVTSELGTSPGSTGSAPAPGSAASAPAPGSAGSAPAPGSTGVLAGAPGVPHDGVASAVRDATATPDATAMPQGAVAGGMGAEVSHGTPPGQDSAPAPIPTAPPLSHPSSSKATGKGLVAAGQAGAAVG